MALTYPAKRGLVLHFGKKESWENEYKVPPDNCTNRTHSYSKGNVAICETQDGKTIQLRYETPSDPKNNLRYALLDVANRPIPAKSALHIENTDQGILISDESGRIIDIPHNGGAPQSHENTQGYSTGGEKLLTQARSQAGSETLDLPSFGVIICFQTNGQKTVFLPQSQTAISFDKPTGYNKPPIFFGKLLNTVTFDQVFASNLGMDIASGFLDPAKLTVALDLGVEPDIKLMNALDPDKTFELLAYLIEKRERGQKYDISSEADISALQKSWNDTVEFEGYKIHSSKKFGIMRDPSKTSYVFKFSADSKASLIAQGMVLDTVLRDKIPATPVLQKDIALQVLFHALEQSGQDLSGHYEEKQNQRWKTIVIQSDKAPLIARNTRQMMIDHFGAEFAARFVSSLSHERDQCVISVETGAFEQAAKCLKASLQAMRLIQAGSADTAHFSALLKDGADLRLVDPKAAASGKSFADHLQDTGNTALLKTLHDAQPIVREITIA